MEVPKSLRIWYVIHFFADILFAIPLFIFPEYTLSLLGFTTIDVVTARLVAAALIGIGTASLLQRNNKIESFQSTLTIKVIWSVTAILGLIISILTNKAPMLTWLIVLIFVIFSGTWIYYKIKLK
ncbi:MAG TPA: hypothetical protein VJI68_01915 [Candidatus Nanoarchaeia archaeon]|nr:hypothetical protein [Candidatus Nanoarchaeia archaeon]